MRIPVVARSGPAAELFRFLRPNSDRLLVAEVRARLAFQLA
jgi:type IV secretory pathway ATPase VirB11/archaellum biosynthesis ATPase